MTFWGRVPIISAAPGGALRLGFPDVGRGTHVVNKAVSRQRRLPGVRAVKVKASVKRICGSCQVIRRKGKVRVICKADPKHKQVQG